MVVPSLQALPNTIYQQDNARPHVESLLLIFLETQVRSNSWDTQLAVPNDPSGGATCAWMAADEVVGCTRAFLTMWRSSRRLVCRGLPEPGLRVNSDPLVRTPPHSTLKSTYLTS
ncbi:hypothetical protein TNCV_4176671 [Trichonephila clavipes]|nr:hypothetical protein TNCV_4176671 [Trichonephila clavipes]